MADLFCCLHTGAPMSLAPVAHVLFNKFMNFNPENPEWANRDRFVLSYVEYLKAWVWQEFLNTDILV